MRPFTSTKSKNAQLGLEAAAWLLDLEDREPDPEHPHPDPAQRQEAFFKWVTCSPDHTRVFLETAETWRRLARIDTRRLIEIQELLEDRAAEIIHLYEPENTTHLRNAAGTRSLRLTRGMAASAAALTVLGIAISVALFRSQTYSTAVGQHDTRVLPDGSVVYLNTDSRIEVDFSSAQRRIGLTRGEALFVVAREAERPFVVSTSGAIITAVGTQFNVREVARGTRVTVVEGAVRVATRDDAATKVSSVRLSTANDAAVVKLQAGEEAKVIGGTVRKNTPPSVTDALSWREWRLVFRNAPLTDIAAEFNRYNRNQIRIEGAQARSKQLTGVFDADRPESLIAYTSKDDTLRVRAVGNDWIISAR